MYRVLVVDDEAYVADYLVELLESHTWREWDICSARSVEEALHWLERGKIDIIITDIRMPNGSGIELAEKVRISWPQCKVIILSAHAEFDYAFEAIKNNVVGYILKTEDDERILDEVNKAVTLIEEEMKSGELLVQTEQYIEGSLAIIRKELLLELLKEGEAEPGRLFGQLRTVGSPLSAEEPMILFAGRIENASPEDGVMERFSRAGLLRNLVHKYFSPAYCCECIEYAVNRFIWLLQPEKPHTSPSRHAGIEKWTVFMEGILDTVQQACLASCGIRMSFVLHGEWVLASQLSGTFRYLDQVMKRHHAESVGFVVTDSGEALADTEPRLYSNKQLPHHIADKLRNSLDNGNKAAFMEELEQVCAWLSECGSWKNTVAWEIHYSVAGVIISYMNQRGLAAVAAGAGVQILFNPQLSEGWADAARCLRHVSEVLFALQEENQLSASNNIIQFLKRYIDGHITQDVSLVKLSEVSGYSNAYLSKIFKKNTGESINDYVTRKKLELIRELMKDDSLSIGDIAAKAGFEYRTYFNRFVNKLTGMSPQEWRKTVNFQAKAED
ncbi:MAG: response regulator [Paenibacillaceae bacterium]|jgi:two-component system response regulator YesN|nr:response regulator [Paenibacillaceae bacterium]